VSFVVNLINDHQGHEVTRRKRVVPIDSPHRKLATDPL
jgi:hypothetical protein